MTSPPAVSIRPPVALRAYLVVFLLVWFAGVIWATVVHRHGSSVLLGGALCVFGGVLAYRLLRLGVHSTDDGDLVVRNQLGTRRLSRTDVEEFRVSSDGGRLGQRSVQALLRDGTTYGLDVCQATFGIGARRMGRQLEQLNAWLRSR